MKNQIVFFHGGGSREDYEADKKLVDSLRSYLAPGWSIHYPFLQDDGSPDLGRRNQIMHEISQSEDGVVLVAHSLGASMLLACLSEFETGRKISGIFLLATPFWQGTEDWVEPFRLTPDFEAKLNAATPTFFYHCRDDEEVPFTQFEIYKQKLPWATFKTAESGGHQFGNNLDMVASDIALI